jgi:hypothetical protein
LFSSHAFEFVELLLLQVSQTRLLCFRGGELRRGRDFTIFALYMRGRGRRRKKKR